MRKHIPNIFTLLNLFLGAVAIVLILTPATRMVQMDRGMVIITLPPGIRWATLLLLAAGLVDFLDGFIARALGVSSELGKQLDSLSDVVSFGVAPSMILYELLQISYLQKSNAIDLTIFPMLPAFLVACFAAWRLATFNIDTRQQYGFIGVPTPITALTVASLPWIVYSDAWGIGSLLLQPWFLYAIILLLSVLMVAPLPLMAMKFKSFSWKENQGRYLLIILSLLLLILLQWIAVPLIYLIYVILSLLFRKQPS